MDQHTEEFINKNIKNIDPQELFNVFTENSKNFKLKKSIYLAKSFAGWNAWYMFYTFLEEPFILTVVGDLNLSNNWRILDESKFLKDFEHSDSDLFMFLESSKTISSMPFRLNWMNGYRITKYILEQLTNQN